MYYKLLKSLWYDYHRLLIVAVLLFLGGIVWGMATFSNVRQESAELIWYFHQLIQGDSLSNPLDLIILIFWNNMIVAFFLFLGGIVIFIPLMGVFVNGFWIGLFLVMVSRLNYLMDTSYLATLLSLIPHGIFELTAIFITAALSTKLFLKIYFNKKIKPELTRWQLFMEQLNYIYKIVIPMIVVAAIIEVIISPLFLDLPDSVAEELSFPIEINSDYTEITWLEYSANYTDPKTAQLTEPALMIFTFYPWVYYPVNKTDQLKAVWPVNQADKFYKTKDGQYLGIRLTEHEDNVDAEKFAKIMEQVIRDSNEGIKFRVVVDGVLVWSVVGVSSGTSLNIFRN